MTAQELFDSMCERIPSALDRHKVPGVALGITCDGHDFVRGFGVTNIKHALPVDEDTLFQIGSNTKTFTATAVMRLVERGKLVLDEPIRTYLSGFSMRDREVTQRVTMRHLLTHVGGWQGDFFPDTGNGDDALAKYVALMAELPQLTPLGTVYSYNNAAFGLAGRVIEVLTGKTYEAALKGLVLEPLRLKHSYFFPTEVMVHRFAAGHATVGDKIIALRPWQLPRAVAAEGGIAASAPDMLRYARFHMGDGASESGDRVLAPESLRLMQTPAPAACDHDLGLSWRIRDIGGVRRIFHGGGTFGQLSFLTFVPQRNFGFTLLTNSMNGGLLARDIARDLLGKFLGHDEPEPTEIQLSRDQLAEFCGRYSAALDDLEVDFAPSGLRIQSRPKGGFPTQDRPAPSNPPPPFRVGFIGPDRIAMFDPPMTEMQGEFLRHPDGSIAWLRWSLRIHARER